MRLNEIKMKKLLILILALSMLCLSSCVEKLTQEEAIAVANELVSASIDLNEIYYGEGLPYSTENSMAVVYAPVTDEAKYLTEAELKEATLSVFTENYSNSIFAMYLTGYSDDDGGVIYARYVDNGERLTVNVQAEPLVEKTRTYDLDSAEIVKLKRKKIVVSYDTFVDGVADVRVEVTLVLSDTESGMVWRIDSPTY